MAMPDEPCGRWKIVWAAKKAFGRIAFRGLIVGVSLVGPFILSSCVWTEGRYSLPTGLTKIATGWRHTCAVTSVGSVKCWGLNHEGQLGDGTTVDKKTPVDVPGVSTGLVAIAAGEQHTCVLTSQNALCWGDNEYGQFRGWHNSGQVHTCYCAGAVERCDGDHGWVAAHLRLDRSGRRHVLGE